MSAQRVSREREQVDVHVGQGRDREHGEDADDDDDDQGLSLGHSLQAEDVEARHHHEDEYGEKLDPGVVVGDGGAGVAPEGHSNHRGDDCVDSQQQPRDDSGEMSSPQPRITYSKKPPADGYRAPSFANEYPCSAATAPASRNEIQTAAPATSPVAPSNAKIPAPTMDPTPMNAA